MSTWRRRSSRPACGGRSVAKLKTNDLLLLAGGGAVIWWLLKPQKSQAGPVLGTMSTGTQPQGFTQSKGGKEIQGDSFAWADVVKTATSTVDTIYDFFGSSSSSSSSKKSGKTKVNSPAGYQKNKNLTCKDGYEWNSDFESCWKK